MGKIIFKSGIRNIFIFSILILIKVLFAFSSEIGNILENVLKIIHSRKYIERNVLLIIH